jgi:hypothetical protein
MKNIYPPGTDHKPYSNNFDNTSMYDVHEKIQIHIHTEKFNNNIYKNIPHKDYIPIYVPPYYNIYESGFTNVRHADIFRKE